MAANRRNSEIERMNLLSKIDRKHPTRLKNPAKFSSFFHKTSDGYYLNIYGRRELKRLEQLHGDVDLNNEPKTIFDGKIVRFYNKDGSYVEKKIFRVYWGVSQKTNDAIVYSTKFGAVHCWSNDAIVYFYINMARYKDNLRDMPKIGRIKRNKEYWYFEPFYIFSYETEDSDLLGT